MLDLETMFGRRVASRLESEWTIWLTTVSESGTPQPRPVWFHWDGDELLMYSQPNTHKLRHIERNPRVAVHLDTDGHGGDVVVMTGEARIDPEHRPADQVEPFVQKYRSGMANLGSTPEQFAESYSVPILVQPDRLRGQ